MVPDDARSVEPALEVGLCADEDAAANLEGLEMLEPDTFADLQTGADAPRDRAPDDRPHRRVHDVVAMQVAGILLDQAVVIDLRLQPLGEWMEERRIGGDPPAGTPVFPNLGLRSTLLARIERTIDIDLPWPRDLEVKTSPQFNQYVHTIQGIFRDYGVL